MINDLTFSQVYWSVWFQLFVIAAFFIGILLSTRLKLLFIKKEFLYKHDHYCNCGCNATNKFLRVYDVSNNETMIEMVKTDASPDQVPVFIYLNKNGVDDLIIRLTQIKIELK